MTEWNYCPVCSGKLIPDKEARPSCAKGHFTKYPTPVSATLAFICNNGEYLALKRSIEPRKDVWDLPGGFVEHEETAYDTLVREINEETGITDLRSEEFLGTFPSNYGDIEKTLATAYVFETGEREVKLSSENSEAGWFKLEEMPELAFQDTRDALELLKHKNGIISS